MSGIATSLSGEERARGNGRIRKWETRWRALLGRAQSPEA